MTAWNWLDWTLAGVTVASVIAAVLKGFVRELVSLACVVLGLVLAAMRYRRVAAWFEDLTRSREVALGAGFLTIFLGSLLLGAVVSALGGKLVKAAGVEWFDRFLGGVFGLVRGMAVDCIVLMTLLAFSMKTDAVQQSTLAPYVATGARVIALVMPGELRTQFRGGFEKLRQTLTQIEKKETKD